MQNVDLALEARNATDFAAKVPWDRFLNDVLPYARQILYLSYIILVYQ